MRRLIRYTSIEEREMKRPIESSSSIQMQAFFPIFSQPACAMAQNPILVFSNSSGYLQEKGASCYAKTHRRVRGQGASFYEAVVIFIAMAPRYSIYRFPPGCSDSQ
jgi:hypothetical protein